MWVPDMPNVPPQNMPVMIAQANQAQSGDTNKIRTIGVCSPSPNHNYSADNGLAPLTTAGNYLRAYEYRTPPATAATATILQAPKHGVLRLLTEADGDTFGEGRFVPSDQLYVYLPDSDYVGNDTATIQVDFGNDLKVNVKYFFQAIDRGGLSGDWMDTYCSKTGVYWKISSTLDANGTITISSVEYQSPVANATDTALTPATLNDWLSLAQLDGKVADMSGLMSSLSTDATSAGITLNTADLPGSAVGQTMGSTITLDTNAAGNGWFIDPTPADNSEFLPTADPTVWMAKQGTAAYGKMDMLSVLLHEYGHALGIEHSANPYDFMGATLTVGERRLPTAAELTLMQQLVAQAKGETTSVASVDVSGSTPADAPIPLDLPLGGSLIGLAGFMGRRYTQYEAAANPSFTGLDTATGWQTQGSVAIAPATAAGQSATATLNEVSGSQTRLNQIFMLGSTDRYLTFTVSGSALGCVKGAPEDAFQVALLDATTGASLLGSDGQTRSDALLSLQADGNQYAASGVSYTINADGSRTYRVDLSNVPKGVAINLSFDLIGFGANDSHITLNNVGVNGGLPQLQDSTGNLLEGGSYQFDPLAQAHAAGYTLLAANVVGSPAHGTITLNADGTFTYTPKANYFGPDSFAYRLTDGMQNSNIATVSLNMAWVNAAPDGANNTVTTLEDKPYIFTAADFGFSDTQDAANGHGANNFAGVLISSIPAAGSLTDNGAAVVAGQSVSVADITAGLLVFEGAIGADHVSLPG